jgi:TRAP-type C4-dicarboxylate transport system substrate-binding protein
MKQMKKPWILLAMALFATPCLAKTTWNANTVWPAKNMHSVRLTEYAEKVKVATKGELEIVVQTSGVLGYKGPQLLKVVRDGRIPISDMLISGVAGDEKIFRISTLPFLVRDFDELRLLTDIARPYFDKAAAKWNQKILYTAPWPGSGLWAKKKIITIKDLKGRKTRVYDMNSALLMEAVGATPLVIPFSDLSTALRTGFIDCIITSTPTAVDARLWEVLMYFEPLNITFATNMVTVNLDAFDKLPKAQQDILVSLGKEQEEAAWEDVRRWGGDTEAIISKNGIETVQPSKQFISNLEKAAKVIWADWLKTATPDGKKIYEEFTKKVKR